MTTTFSVTGPKAAVAALTAHLDTHADHAVDGGCATCVDLTGPAHGLDLRPRRSLVAERRPSGDCHTALCRAKATAVVNVYGSWISVCAAHA